MRKIITILIPVLFIFSGAKAQESKKKEPAEPELSQHEIEIIQSSGYAYAEAYCRYEFSKLLVAKNPEDNMLLNKMNDDKKVFSDLLDQRQEKYSKQPIFTIYMDAYSDGLKKLHSCVRLSKLKEQNKLEENSEN